MGQEQTRGADARIAELAERQHGVVGWAQLRDLGLADNSIGWRVRSGRLHRLSRGVYAVGHRLVSRDGHWMAAVLAAGRGRVDLENPAAGAVISHRSAAALWGIWAYAGGSIHVTTPHKSRSSGAIRRHFAKLPSDEVTVEDGIPVTTVSRTIFDLAAAARPEGIERMVREVEFRRLYDRVSLSELLRRHPRHRGANAIRVSLAKLRRDPEGRIRSRLEERFLPFVDRHRLPRPRFNAWLEVGGRWYQVDCLWPRQRQIVELDGWEGHGTRRAFRDDRARDRRLRVAGYAVTRLTWGQLDDEPEQIAADLRRLLGAERGRESLTYRRL
ncbi:MAG TPA: type IV toxin-antitoxin system AbiEi family antitoxin domain-containing protein [Solirubrobacterales bacterium]